MSLCGSHFIAVLGHVARFAAEETEVLIHAMLSFLLCEPSIGPNLEARSEGSFGVPYVLVLLILEPEEMGLSPLLPFLFAAVWAGGLGDVLPLSFDLSWLPELL